MQTHAAAWPSNMPEPDLKVIEFVTLPEFELVPESEHYRAPRITYSLCVTDEDRRRMGIAKED